MFANILLNIALIPLNSDLLEFFEYLQPFLKYECFNFKSFDSAPYSVLKV